MMTQPTLTVEKHYLNWPLNRPLNQADIMHELGVHASDENGQDLTSKVMMNLTQVDVNKVGEYPVMLNVIDNNGQSAQASITLNIQPMRTQNAPKETATSPKSRRGWLWVIIVIVVILCAWWAISSHNRQAANQAATDSQQSSQISNNSSSISDLTKDNQRLASQVAELKGATQQYQKDHDQQALESRLDKIQSQIQDLQNQVQSNSVKQDLNQVNETVNEVRENPNNGTKIVNNLKNKGDFQEIWGNISQEVQKWLDEFAN